MKIQIILEADIDGENSDDLLGHIEEDIVDIVRLAFEDNLNVEGYAYDPETITTQVIYKGERNDRT